MLLVQKDFIISRCKELIDLRREESVNGDQQNPTEIRCFNIKYIGQKGVRFSVKAGLFIYNSYPYHVRLLDPIPATTNGNYTSVQRLTRLSSNRMGIHWKEGNDNRAMIELSQSRLHPDGNWSNIYCASLDQIYEGAQIPKNGQIEKFYNKFHALLGERRNLLYDENPNSRRKNYQCCLFRTETDSDMNKVVMYSYLLARIRPIFYGYTTEKKFLNE